jgi:hypothetical protein
MSSTPKELLEKFSQSTTILPGLSEREIEQFRQQLQCPISDEMRQLLLYSAGFESKPFGVVRFTGHEGFELAEVFPRSVPLLPDGCGNFWAVDINPQNGAWGSVFYACHDPAVIAVQAEDLVTFLLQLRDPSKGEPKDAVHYVHEEAVSLIWHKDPWLISVQDARLVQDGAVSRFAGQLPDNFRVADLRSLKVGSGFSWGKAGPDAEIRRNGAELVFGVEQRSPGLLGRIFSRHSSA